ncbi:MAG: hypothetical protein N2050_09475, partial [Flavobacteriales bacterium]|nr:hypothetical protein [Flavobacteriales bacterium]
MLSKIIFSGILGFFLGDVAAQAPLRQVLDRAHWKFFDATHRFNGMAEVPGHLYRDVYRMGLAPHPYSAEFEKIKASLDSLEWTYVCRFDVWPELWKLERKELVFYGLDTYARVFLNGKQVLFAENMHRLYRVPVEKWLLPEKNELKIVFHPTSKKAQKWVRSFPRPLPGGLYPFVRKPAFQFGWDFCPPFLGCGVVGSVVLEAWQEARMSDIFCHFDSITDTLALGALEVMVEAGRRGRAKLEIFGAFEGTGEFDLRAGLNICRLPLRAPHPKFWQPNGLGKAHLYRFEVALSLNGKRLESRHEKAGICQVELVENPDAWGKSFYFRVNSRPLFAKGANVVPPDALNPWGDRSYWSELLTECRKAGFNMLRVWGGGVYASDDFMTLCDSLGILVWQDFPYACAMYPGSKQFLKETQKEAEENIRRLRRHPSLALWCGNNESSEGWHNWGWQKALRYTLKDSLKVWKDYQKWFENLLPQLVQRRDPGRCYTASSPRHGWGRSLSLVEGDCHYWGVWWGGEPFESYPQKVPRFMSEFGFQAWPSLETLKPYATLPELPESDSLFIRSRQRHPFGFKAIKKMMDLYFRDTGDVAHQAYLTRCLQALGVGLGIEAHIQAMPYCMGTLFWQLNDAWPGISWSAIDYRLRPKILFSALERYYFPILLSFRKENREGEICWSNSGPDTLWGRLSASVLSFSGDT